MQAIAKGRGSFSSRLRTGHIGCFFSYSFSLNKEHFCKFPQNYKYNFVYSLFPSDLTCIFVKYAYCGITIGWLLGCLIRCGVIGCYRTFLGDVLCIIVAKSYLCCRITNRVLCIAMLRKYKSFLYFRSLRFDFFTRLALILICFAV